MRIIYVSQRLPLTTNHRQSKAYYTEDYASFHRTTDKYTYVFTNHITCAVSRAARSLNARHLKNESQRNGGALRNSIVTQVAAQPQRRLLRVTSSRSFWIRKYPVSSRKSFAMPASACCRQGRRVWPAEARNGSLS